MFLSFIVPVYNTEKYIEDCLRSILNQDIPQKDYEIVCVNDGSTDSSLEILRCFEQQYSNIRVLNQNNRGVCQARNAGLQAAVGEYIWFVDADDMVTENILSRIWESLQESQDRMVVGGCEFSENGEPALISNAWEDTVVWRNLFRRQFLLDHNLRFHYPELTFGEDGLFMYEVKRQLPTKTVFPQTAYWHRNRPGSLSTELSPETEERRLKNNIREAEILKGYYEAGGILETETADRFVSFLWGSLFRISLMPGADASPHLRSMKEKGLYPYKRPKECTITKCPEIKRNDAVGKLFDILYTNLASPWGYHGMRFVHRLFWIKQHLFK